MAGSADVRVGFDHTRSGGVLVRLREPPPERFFCGRLDQPPTADARTGGVAVAPEIPPNTSGGGFMGLQIVPPGQRYISPMGLHPRLSDVAAGRHP